MRIWLGASGFLILAIALPGAVTAQPAIPAGSAVYIESLDSVIDEHFRSELARQKVALKVVSSQDEAQFMILSAEEKSDSTITPLGGGAISLSVRHGGTVLVQDKTTKTTVWSQKWEVRSYDPKQLRKTASALVGTLKKAVRSSPPH